MRLFRFPISATSYFVMVAILTILCFLVVMQFRPALAYEFREFLGIKDQRFDVAEESFYALRVAPIFESRCNSCHGDIRQKANLRTDSFARVMLGGRSGPAIKTGSANDSELFRRLTLPSTDERAMPPEGKPPLKDEEVTVIRLWIEAGASGTQPASQFKDAPEPPVEVTFEEIDYAAVKEARAPLASTVSELQARYPGIVAYESRGSANIQLNASLMREKFADADLNRIAPLSQRIVWADFSGTSITDASADVLANMAALRVLRLMNTGITDETIKSLESLQNLQSLNIVGTATTNNAILALKKSTSMKIYGAKED